MLPFAIPGSDTFFDVTPEIRVQRYGCVTVSEAIALQAIFTPELQELINNPAIELEASIHARAILTAILLISRYEPATTLDDVMQLPIDRIVAASNFLMEERSADRQTSSEEEESAEPIDWEKAWFKLRRHYPAIEQFNSANFGNCPLRWIRKALDVLHEEELERLDAEATAIALFAYYNLHGQGMKPELDHLNPWHRIITTRQAKAEIPIEAAQTFLDLSAQGKIPAWVVAIAPIDRIRRAAA